jgi:phosphonatase-like hydrolase
MHIIKLVVFDMAGTTVDEDNVVYKTLHSTILGEGFNVSLLDVLQHGAGKEKHQAIKDVLGAKSIQGFDSKEIFNKFQKNLDVAYEHLEAKSFDGVPSLLKTLREKEIKIALNTGYNRRIAKLLLAKLGWREAREYDTLVTADDVSNGRPHPDMIYLAMQKPVYLIQQQC